MDAFYASVEQRDNPELRGKPVIVGGGGNRGVVAAASYEVRRFGVHSAMPTREALRRCPDAIVVHPRIGHYSAVSQQIFAVFHEFTPLVQGLSLDEAFLDVTASRSALGNAEHIAREIKRRIRERTELTASVGVAPNKLVAKIASDLRKPDGLVIVREADVRDLLDPLPIRKLFGLGAKTAPKVEALGIHTLGDLRQAEPVATAAGLRPLHRTPAATRGRHRRSSGDPGRRREADQCRGDLRHRHCRSRAPACRNRPAGRQGVLPAAREEARGRVRHGEDPPRRLHDLHAAAAGRAAHAGNARGGARSRTELLDAWRATQPRAALRLLGVGVSDLGEEVQGDLFGAPESTRNRQLDATVDAVREKFGSVALRPASTIVKPRE